MNLKEYIEGLQKFAKERPELMSAMVVGFSDDEGNSCQEVDNAPDVFFTLEADVRYIEVVCTSDLEEEVLEEYITVVSIN